MAQGIPAGDFEKEDQTLSLGNHKLRLAVLAFFFLGLFLLALGAGLFLFRGTTADKDIEIISAADSKSVGEIIVHVDGAVTRPGVYKLKADSRVNDAIGAAGGLTSSADRSKINLAAKVLDGQKVHVPVVGESVSPADAKALAGKQSVSGSVSQVAGESASQLIDINTASEAELDRLPSIGPVTAQKIIASRPYSDSGDLLTKKVVSSSVYEKIKGMITY